MARGRPKGGRVKYAWLAWLIPIGFVVTVLTTEWFHRRDMRRLDQEMMERKYWISRS